MIPKGLRNPFQQSVSGDTWTAPVGAVPDLYPGVVGSFKDSVETARADLKSSGLLILGQAGAGKTHLIAQLRQEYFSDTTVCFVSVPLETHPGRIWRHIRERLVGELLNKKWATATPGLTGLLRILTNRFPDWNPLDKSGGIGTKIWGRNLEKELRDLLAEFSAECAMPANVRRVLPQLWNKDNAQLAADWLRGQPLTDEELKKLQLPLAEPSESEAENQSRELVLGLCLLAGTSCSLGAETTLVICFDQLEGFVGGKDDPISLQTFTVVANQLLEVSGPRLIVSFMRPQFHSEVFQKNVDPAYQARIAQMKAVFPPLSWEQAVKLVLTRMSGNPAFRDEKLKHADMYWPFSESDLRRLVEAHATELTPRSVILGCAVRYQELASAIPQPAPQLATGTPKVETPPAQGKPPVSPPTSPPAVPLPVKDDIADLWAKRREKHLKALKAIKFDDVFGSGIPWLRELLGVAGKFVEVDSRLPNVSLLLDGTQVSSRTGVAFCNQEPRSLWPRLKNLVAQQKAGREGKFLDQLVLVRAASATALSDTSKGYIEQLTKAGAKFVSVTNEQLAHFAAYQELITKTRNGDVTRNGLAITDLEYNTWARRHLTPEVRQLAEALFGTLPAAERTETTPPAAAKASGETDQLTAKINLEFA